jgi:catechol 2,3-dioxygenase-like lactoylglutathione lyase family enzyme
MRIEHVAFHVADPAAMAAWYVEHLGFTIKRKIDESPFMHFIADGSGTMMFELYRQPHLRVPDYRETDPSQLHVAFVSDDIEGDRQRLLAAGATAVGDPITPGGDVLAMLRDPWGLAIQLAQRAEPMV